MVENQNNEKSSAALLQTKSILSLSEAALIIGLSKSSIYKLTSKRLIPHYSPGGKLIYFKREDLDAWMLQNRRETVSERNADAISKFQQTSQGRRTK